MRRRDKLGDLRASLARAQAKKQSLAELKWKLEVDAAAQDCEYEALQSELAQVKPQFTPQFSAERQSLNSIIDLCVEITARVRNEEASLRDELEAAVFANAELESARDCAVEEKERISRLADSRAREVDDTITTLQQEVEFLRTQCVERELEQQQEVSLREELAAALSANAELERLRNEAVEERCRIAQAAETKAQEVSDTVITLQEEVELLRTQCLERENEQNEVELLRMQCAEKEQQIALMHEESCVADKKTHNDTGDENRTDLLEMIEQLELEKAEVTETLLGEIEELRISNREGRELCSELQGHLEAALQSEKEVKEEVLFVRRLHVDAVTKATALQGEMEETLLRLREENSELRHQASRNRLGSIPEEDCP